MDDLSFDIVTAYYLHYSDHTTKDHSQNSFRLLRSFYDNVFISDITRQSLRDYLHARRVNVCDATVSRELRDLKAAINFYINDHQLSIKNPLSNFYIAESEPRLRFLTRSEAKRLIDATCINYHLHCFVKLGLNTGMRTGEILKLDWDRVDFDNRYIVLNRSNTKSRRRRFIALNPAALDILQTMQAKRQSDKWVFYNQTTDTHILSLKKGFRSACINAHITDLRPHDLRHTFASWLVQSGVPLYTIRDLLGHSCITTTERYAHLQIDNLRDALKHLPVI